MKGLSWGCAGVSGSHAGVLLGTRAFWVSEESGLLWGMSCLGVGLGGGGRPVSSNPLRSWELPGCLSLLVFEIPILGTPSDAYRIHAMKEGSWLNNK